ncbi:MAG: ABC transporter substrate-binding protein [Rhodopila sp.]|jgi:NitT/TauT family transport system substrate-binding protein
MWELSRRKLLASTFSAGLVPLATAWAEAAPLEGPPRKVTLAWMPTALCHIAVPVAEKQGFFQKHNLDVEFVNWAGSTDLLLEAISTGKADAGVGMVLRWLKPMEQGFDVKLTAGTHGGCMHVLAASDSGLTAITDLRHKRVGVGDVSGVDKNFFSIVLQKKGIDPNSEVEWKQFPPDMLGEALKKGEIDALSTSDPLAFILKRDNGLIEVTNNLENGYQTLACCVLGVRGSLIRNDKPTVAAITLALIEAAAWANDHPDESAEIYAPYAPKQRASDLAKMLKSVTSDVHPIQQEFQQQIALYVEDLKSVGVIKSSVDPAKFAGRVCADVLV